MKETSKIFLEKLFNPDEEICISANKYANVSIPQYLLNEEVFQIESQDKDRTIRNMREDDIELVSINPIKGDRNDENVTAFRSFLVEIDGDDVYEQKQYIESLKMPYTVCVFSGNKSLHYGIVLKEELPDAELWRVVNEWILAIVTKADQQTKNPSRSIRFPGNVRKSGKKLPQVLIDVKDRVEQDVLFDWLNQYPDRNPALKKMIERKPMGDMEYEGIPIWMVDKLSEGVGSVGNRNKEWFCLAIELAKKGANEETIIQALGPFFTPEHDFPLKEWHNTIKSAVKIAQRG